MFRLFRLRSFPAFGLCLLACLSLQAQNAPRPKLTPEQMAQDFQILTRGLAEVHPALYLYTDSVTLAKAAAEILQELKEEKDLLHFYRLTRRWVNLSRCGHTYVETPEEYEDAHFRAETTKIFPFRLTLANGQAFVLHNGSANPAIQPGSRILSINGQPFEEVLAQLLPYFPADGFNETFKIRAIEDGFFRHYYLYVAQPDSFRLVYRLPAAGQTLQNQLAEPDTGAVLQAVAPAESFNCFQAACRRRYVVPEPPALQAFRFSWLPNADGSETALLTVNEFSKTLRLPARDVFANAALPPRLLRGKVSQRRFIRLCFKLIKKRGTKKLLIDFRENDGGADVLGNQLFALLTSRPFRYLNYYEAVSIRPLCCQFAPNAGASFRGYGPWRFFVVKKLGERKYRIRKIAQPDLRLLRPARKSLRFDGQVGLLIGGKTFSAGAQFAAKFKSEKRGFCLGEETGGGYQYCSAGRFLYLQLPHSGLVVRIPQFKQEMNVAADQPAGRGVMPDVVFLPRAQDLFLGFDPALEAAKKRLENQP